MFIKQAFSGFQLRLFVILSLIGFISAMVIAVIIYVQKFEERLGEDTNIRLEETAQYAADHIITVMSETQKKLRGVAAALATMTSSSQKMSYLRQVSREAGFVYLGYANVDGELHATIGSESRYIGNDANFIEGMAGRDSISDYIYKIFYDRATRGLILTVPIFARNPRPDPVGVLVAMLDAKKLREALSLQSFNGAGYAFIVDRSGRILMQTRNLDFDNIFLAWQNYRFENKYSLVNFESALLDGKNGMTIFANAKGQRQFVYHYALPFNQWTLICMVSARAVAGHHVKLIQELTLFAFLTILIFFLLIGYALYSYWQASRSKLSAKAKSDFLSSMSHEIRTPLNGIIGLNYLMRGNIDDKEKMMRFLDQSQTTAQYLLALINDILDINKLDADKMEMANKPFRLDSLVDNLLSIFMSILRQKEIDFQVDTSYKAVCLIGDEVRLKQVLTNILGNASKFTPKDGKVIFKVSQTPLNPREVKTRFEITDTGCGMSEKFQRQIFDAFSQERNTCTKGNEGTGLGMAISYQIMNKLGGSLRVKSKLGKGSQFIAELISKIDTEAQQIEAPADMDQERSTSISRINRVLVAEDNDLNRDLLKEILEMNGMNVSVAEDGKKAVEIFAASKPYEFDVILMDMQMPVMDGLQATRAIRALKREDAKNILIYACTANSFEEDREKCLESGMSDFLAKPVNVPLLLDKLKRLNRATQKS